MQRGIKVPTLSDAFAVGILGTVTFAVVFYVRLLFMRNDVSAGRWQRQIYWVVGGLGHLIGRLVEAVLCAIVVGVFAALGWLDAIVVAAVAWISNLLPLLR